MKNIKKALAILLVVAISVSAGILGTLAYLTDSEEKVNVMTVGSIDIELLEHQRNEEGTALEEFVQGNQLMPLVGSAQGEKDGFGLVKQDVAKNYIDKIVRVKNTGENPAYVRVYVAFPAALDAEKASDMVVHWNQSDYFNAEGNDGTVKIDSKYAPEAKFVKEIVIDNVEFNLYSFTYNEVLPAGETTAYPALTGVYLDSRVDYDDDKNEYFMMVDGNRVVIDYDLSKGVYLPVFAQAIQADGYAGYTEAFAALGDDTSWIEDTILPTPVEPWDGTTKDTSWYNAAETTYKLGTAEAVAGFAELVNNGNSFSGKTITLTKDIDLADKEWTPIGQTGTSYGAIGYFQGNFDGQGHTISNMSITTTNVGEHYAAGFFGFLDCGQTGTIKNVNFDNAKVNGHHWTGVVAGYLSGNLENCKVTNSTVKCTHANDDACGDKAGAVVGYINGTQGKVTSCSAENCTVTAGRDAGQVVGCAPASQIVDCSATNVTVSAAGGCTGANIKNEVLGRVS